MKKLLKSSALILCIFALHTSCNSASESGEGNEEVNGSVVDYDKFMTRLTNLENYINSNLTNPNKDSLKKAVSVYQDLAVNFPEDPLAADYLFKASDLALSTGQPQKSVKILTRIMDNYPEYERMEDVMFNKASHLDFELRDTTRAKELYSEFILKYPESELVDDAESRIENISLSLEELVNKFMNDMDKNPEAEQ